MNIVYRFTFRINNQAGKQIFQHLFEKKSIIKPEIKRKKSSGNFCKKIQIKRREIEYFLNMKKRVADFQKSSCIGIISK